MQVEMEMWMSGGVWSAEREKEKDQGSMHRISNRDKNIVHGRSSASVLRETYERNTIH